MIKRLLIFLTSVIILSTSSIIKGSQDPLAVILKAEGNVKVTRSDGKEYLELKSFFELFEGDSITVYEEAIIEICFVNGDRKTSFGYDKFVISHQISKKVEQKKGYPIFTQILNKLNGSSKTVKMNIGATRSLYDEFSILSPRKCYIQFQAINFRWVAVKYVDQYEFILSDKLSFDSPIYSKIVQDTTVLIFPDSLHLLRNKNYYWKVRTLNQYYEFRDSSFFQIYSFDQENHFLEGKEIISNIFGEFSDIPLIVYFDVQKAYYNEYEFLVDLINQESSNPIYYQLMADLLNNIGIPNLVYKYSVKTQKIEEKNRQ